MRTYKWTDCWRCRRWSGPGNCCKAFWRIVAKAMSTLSQKSLPLNTLTVARWIGVMYKRLWNELIVDPRTHIANLAHNSYEIWKSGPIFDLIKSRASCAMSVVEPGLIDSSSCVSCRKKVRREAECMQNYTHRLLEWGSKIGEHGVEHTLNGWHNRGHRHPISRQPYIPLH